MRGLSLSFQILKPGLFLLGLLFPLPIVTKSCSAFVLPSVVGRVQFLLAIPPKKLGSFQQMNKEVTKRALDRAKKSKLVIEKLTEEETEIVKELKAERAANETRKMKKEET